MNLMKTIKVEKITLNMGTGKDQGVLEKGLKLLKTLTKVTPVKTITQKRIQEWGVRPGLAIGCKTTLRKTPAEELLVRLLEAKEKHLKKSQFDAFGNISFGIHEYIDIPGSEYDPDIGIMGLEVCITLQRPGFRIKKRKIQKRKIPKTHQITKEEAIEFMKNKYNVVVEE